MSYKFVIYIPIFLLMAVGLTNTIYQTLSGNLDSVAEAVIIWSVLLPMLIATIIARCLYRLTRSTKRTV